MKRFLAILMAALLCAAMLPTAALADSGTRTVYVSSTGSGTLNLRSGPGKEYDSTGYVQHGDKVTVSETHGEWSRVKVSGSGKAGWIKTKYIDGTTKQLGTGSKTVKVPSGESLTLRAKPSTGAASRGTVKNGAKVKVLETEDDWVRVSVNSTGKTGWIKAKYIGAGGSGSSSGSSSSTSGGSQKVYKVTGSAVNLRKGPSATYGKVATLSLGTAFKRVGADGNWLQVETFSGLKGWISQNYAAAGAKATVTGASVNVRKGAGTGYGVVGSLAKGTSVTVDSVTGSWAHVSYGGMVGYMAMSYLKF